jgi:arsenite methyltransferase
MAAIFGFSRDRILAAVRDMYTAVAATPDGPFHFPVGAAACRRVGYEEALLTALPADALESFAGVGCPFRAGAIRPGDTVLDIGSGSGTDALIACRLAGPRGAVYALDLTPAMAAKLRRMAAREGLDNLVVVIGNAEAIPLADGSVDVVTSNGMLNLVPDKRRAAREIFRVLRPDGRLQIADIVIRRPVTRDCAQDPKLWAECVVGATVDEDYLALFRDAGFEDVTVVRDHDYFALSSSAPTREVAQRFGAYAVEISARRAAAAPSPLAQLMRRASPRRLLRRAARRGMLGWLALVSSMLACYGTLAATALLSAAGFTVAVHETAWAAAVVGFSSIVPLALLPGARAHRRYAVLAPSLVGVAALVYVQFVDYDVGLELAAFGLIAASIALDFRLRRRVAPQHAHAGNVPAAREEGGTRRQAGAS